MNIPQPFNGTREQAAANRRTHNFDWESDRCMSCDCRAWGVYADHPCGADVPRIDVADEVAAAVYAGTPLAQIGGTG